MGEPQGEGGVLIVPPDAAGTVESLASIGYSPQAAVADLVDNSLAARARTIDITCHWAGGDSWVAIRDDGDGMNREELIRGMTVGGRALASDRRPEDLGRFGMGLKTASFSQARQVTVSTADGGGPRHEACWDLDHVAAAGAWELLTRAPAEARPPLEALARPGPGTTVLWRRLTHMVPAGATAGDSWSQSQFHREAGAVERHLSMTFGRYLTRRREPVAITLNGENIKAWDPFLGGHRSVAHLAPEEPMPGVRVQGFVLPHRDRFTTPDGSRFDDAAHEAAGGPAGWLEQQGFYVYRRDRLLVAGGWLDLGLRRDERHALARLSVHLDTDQDLEWSLDVAKSRAVPPPALRKTLLRHAHMTRERAEAVLTHRGRIAATPGRRPAPADAAWLGVSRHGRTMLRINRDHPLVKRLREDAGGDLEALLRIVEQTLPVDLIRAGVADADDPAAGMPEGAGTTAAAPGMRDMVADMLAVLIRDGMTPDAARRRCRVMPPFDRHPHLVQETEPSREPP